MIHTVFRTRRNAFALAVAIMLVGGSLPAQESQQQPDSQPQQPESPQQAEPAQQPESPPPQAESQPAEGTHTVKTGDTLWDLARTYLGDPFQWPEIYRINTDVVEDPHWIYPGEVLRIPGRGDPTMVATEAEEPQGEETEAPVAEGDRAAPGSTVFSRSLGGRRGVYSRRGGIVGRELTTAVRPGEFYAAPWIDRSGGPGEAGQVVAQTDLPGIARASDRPTLQPQDRVYITLPKSIVPTRGDRLLVYRVGPQVEGHGQIVIPTAVVQVERADAGDATTVRIVEQYDPVEVGQGVLPLERFNMPADARPAPLALGTEARVIWIPSEAVLPSLQRYVVLTATNKDNVKQGDQFTLYRPRLRTERGVFLPEEKIALVQVVRVTDRGTTGIIVDQAQPAIRHGTSARLTARMP